MTETHNTPEGHWWQREAIYEVYPRSFLDTDGDGVGDLTGIRRKLDYLEWLGVGAIWLTPVFRSPMRDFGYDISDYMEVDPTFGTLADLDQLLTAAHARGIKVILDFVPNHTSDQHPWFLESRSSRGSAKRDWYIWRQPAPDGGAPNNWLCVLGTSAWQLDSQTGEYYYHAFLPEQPDLNWRHNEVRAAMLEVMRYWLDRGFDGFRVDVIWHLMKDEQFRDNPVNPAYVAGMPADQRFQAVFSTDRPDVHEVIAEWRRLVDSYPAVVLIGEAYLPVERLVAYYGTSDAPGVHLPFNFHLFSVDWSADAIAKLVETYEAALPENAWPNWVLGNHDQSRIASRLGPERARLAAFLVLTLRGTPTIYYGDELGMTDVAIPNEQVRDTFGQRVLGLGRDAERTPMLWSGESNAGFTNGSPWLPVSPDSATQNVTALTEDKRSILWLYRRLLGLRREQPALSIGGFTSLGTQQDVFSFLRQDGKTTFLVMLNFNAVTKVATAPLEGEMQVVLSSTLEREGERYRGTIPLGSFEALLLRPAPAAA
jgi:alpha-glucosidase